MSGRDDLHAIVTISTTFASRDAAETCGRQLVEARLAACVQVEGPATSLYRWEERLEVATEWRCVCKTTAERQGACVAAIAASHPYQIPQILVHDVLAAASYATWVRAAVASL